MSLRRIVGGVAVAVTLALTIALAAVWAPDRTVADLTPRWAPAPSRFIDVGGLRVHIRDEGPATDSVPILLLHGTSASLHTWDGWAADLRRDHRVIRLDLPGFGLTGPFPDDDYTIAHYLRFLGATLDSLHVSRVIVAGNSFGGELAWSFALVEPSRTAAIVLVDAAGYPFVSTSVPIGFRLARTPGLSRLLTLILPRSVVASSVRNTYGSPERVDAALIDRYYELTLREGNRAALPRRFASQSIGNQVARVPTLTLPTLILWGMKDRLIPPSNGDRFHKEIAGSTLVTFDDLGHVPMEEDPARTVAAMRTFLAGLPSAGTLTSSPAASRP